jgi:hypothetical protein
MSQGVHNRGPHTTGDLDELRAVARHIRLDGLGEQLQDLLGQIDRALAGISSVLPQLVELAHTVEPPASTPRSRRRPQGPR